MQPEPRFNITDEPCERGIRTPASWLAARRSPAELSRGVKGGKSGFPFAVFHSTPAGLLCFCACILVQCPLFAESRNRELNSEPPVYKTGALAIELFRQAQVSPTPGVEPEHGADLLMFFVVVH